PVASTRAAAPATTSATEVAPVLGRRERSSTPGGCQMSKKANIPGWRDTEYRHIAFDEADGVLEVRLHSNEGPLLWGTRPHEEIGHACRQIAADEDVRVVVLTGTGDAFIDQPYVPEGPKPEDPGTASAAYSSRLDTDVWDSIYFHAERLQLGLLDIK